MSILSIILINFLKDSIYSISFPIIRSISFLFLFSKIYFLAKSNNELVVTLGNCSKIILFLSNKYFLDNVDKRTWCVRQADVATNVAYCIDHFAKVEQGGFVEEELFAPLHLSGKAKVKFAPSMQEKELAADVEELNSR